MFLLQPCPRPVGGGEVPGGELGGEFLAHGVIHSTAGAFLRTGLVTFQKGIQSVLANHGDKPEEVTAGDAAQFRNLCRGVFAARG